MKYTYLDYLSESKIRLYNALGILIVFSVISLIVFIIVFSQGDLYSNNVSRGQVSQIRLDTVERMSEARYSNHYIKTRVLRVSLDNKTFVLERQYKDYREELLSEIQIGDTIKVFYKSDSDNQLMPLQIEKNKKILLPFSFFYNQRSVASIVSAIVFIITSTIIITLVFKRSRFLTRTS